MMGESDKVSSQGAGTLSLRFLGPPEMALGGEPVEVDTRKATALVAYLAITGETHRREALAALLYPDYDQERAHANLRRTLWSLNNALGEGWVEADRDTIGLADDADVWTDVQAFRRHLDETRTHDHPETEVCPRCLAPLARAAALYRGDFLSGFTLPDSAAFDDWQFFEAESLRQELASALERLVSGHSAAGDVARAIEYARQWLALDPLHEPAHRRLMRLYVRDGRRAAALRQYETCVRVLDKDLGVEPQEETTRLYEAIEGGELPLPVVDAPGAEDFAETVATPSHNLPPDPTPFVGRTDELERIDTLLKDHDCRLLTLVGPGGVGKTRLAMRAAYRAVEEAQGSYPDRVIFVSLAAVESPRFLEPTIASELDFSFFQREGVGPREQLLDYLRGREMLLVLDNFEHLLEGSHLLAEIVTHAPGVKLLVTSRERLHLRGEYVLTVEGMRFPEDRDEPVESLADYSAVALFLERARHADASFVLDGDGWTAVVRICHLLEGLPLGIELAAAWVRMLSCQEIADEIERGLDFLSTELRDVPERHRSLRAVVDQSWRLLSQAERSALAQLSVFRGGFEREAAEEVAGADLRLLAALGDKSLLRRARSGRYGMHEAVRRYAAEKLKRSGIPDSEAVVRDRHCRYYTAYLTQRSGGLRGPRGVEVVAEVAREIENVRAAWNWAVSQGDAGAIRRAAGGLSMFFYVRTLIEEGEEAFRRAAIALESVRESGASEEIDRTLGLVLAHQGRFAEWLYRQEESQALLHRSLALLRPLGMGEELATANLVAVAVGVVEDVPEAERLCREALTYFRSVDSAPGIGMALQLLGALAQLRGQTAAAQRYLEETIALLAQAGDRWGMAFALFDLATLIQQQGGERVEAKRTYQHSLQIWRELGGRWGMAICLDHIGYLARELGDYDAARRLHQESHAISREIGDQLGIAGSLDNLGLVARDVDNMAEAQRYFREGLELRRQVGKPWEVGVSLRHMGDAAQGLDQLAAAERWYRESLDTFEGAWESWGLEITLARLAEVILERGDIEAAQARFRDALRTCLKYGTLFNGPRILLGVSSLLAVTGRGGLAADLLAYVKDHVATTARARRSAEEMLGELTSASSAVGVEALHGRFSEAELRSVLEQMLAELGS